MDGLLIVDKPRGITSHDVVRQVRRALKTRKVGHAGTLDPLATGLLLVAVGEGTRVLQFLMEGDKTYRARLKLGETTDTQDSDGKVIEQRPWQGIGPQDVERACASFRGEIRQVPPMYSALKKDGVPLYRLARQGIEIEREERPVTIHRLEILQVELPAVAIEVDCSKGTYIRTLVHDIGQALGCGAHLTELRRTRSGLFSIERALTLEQLAEGVELAGHPAWLSLGEALGEYPAVQLVEEACRRLRNGIPPALDEVRGGENCRPGERALLYEGPRLLAIASFEPGRELEQRGDFRLLRVFNRG
ncbi:tRNA pseudouridine synthase B [Desulfuromonas versatilis]|uniref:tRNA pseudouridine synthase B n=1 Tax=Desulfuromonas versatilis TaxID=2802975 RepID=A0ABM8HUT5_9BACT|nr:tRNA pseudouridine(55) synthase TruB [Desulfuromonas versatilis]BCR04831.1 tRNA pseudouridine synthase B [Desulfuromonas versatilis]